MLRAVLDSNVVLAAHGASNPLSPNKEIVQRWSVGEFIWLVTADVAAEYAEKLLDQGQAPQAVEDFITGLFLLAECIEIRFFPKDPAEIQMPILLISSKSPTPPSWRSSHNSI